MKGGSGAGDGDGQRSAVCRHRGHGRSPQVTVRPAGAVTDAVTRGQMSGSTGGITEQGVVD